MENNKFMQKILVCLYVIIALLSVNTLVLILTNIDAADSNKEAESDNSYDYDVSMFEEITGDDIEEVMETEGTQVIYVGRETCGYCVAFLPALQQAQREYGYKTKYLDISKVTTEEIQEKVLKLDNEEKVIANNFWATPKVLIVKDGKLVDVHIGYDEYDELASFLEENGITK